MISLKIPQYKAITAVLGKIDLYYRKDPEFILEGYEQWWFGEGKRVYATQGASIEAAWSPLSPKWAKEKGSEEINVLTGALKAGLTGTDKTKVVTRKAKSGKLFLDVGVTTHPRVFNSLNKMRPLAKITHASVQRLDAIIQHVIDAKINPRLKA